MAKFRQNHARQSKGSSFAIKGFVVTIVLFGILLFGFYKFGALLGVSDPEPAELEEFNPDKIDYLPSGHRNDVVHHNYYSLGYNENHEQADWVAYRLTKESIQAPNVKRERNYRPDYSVKSRSAFHRDYTNSGYTRGHLAPAGDMAFNTDAMKESFFMSNMSPQIRSFNNGVWKELEETVRDWAYDNEEVYVITGPIFFGRPAKRIGENKVAVPDAFYKAILDITTPSQKSIAFIIPHEKSEKHLREYAVSIDKLEEHLGFDIFPDLYLSKNEEMQLESAFNIREWRFNDKKFRARVDKWNYQ
ncbi:MAG: DNA/RNA non-specific endonuclease [Bacteroidia bacterium]|nr:DNA/RNA non-specific endonuclease [Bacteroidia bacterium]